MNKYRKIINIGFVGLLIAVLALTYDIYSDRKDDRIQSTRIALLTQQLGTQEKMATVQSKMATAQSNGGLSSTDATAIAEEYSKLKSTQVALATRAANLEKKSARRSTPQPTSTPSVTSTATPTPTAIQNDDPAYFIQHYYDEINNRNYEKTWDMLSKPFQKEKSGTFERYIAWWDTIEKVDLGDITILSQDDTKAEVKVVIHYYKKDGSDSTSTTTFTLISDAQNGWLIDQSK